MDGRIALAPGAALKLRTSTGYTLYTIRREIGRGGSCIVYDASYTDNLGNYKLVRVKECYPHALRIARAEDGTLTPQPRDEAAFAAAKDRMTQAYQRNHRLFMNDALTNAVANTSNLHEANGTVYIVSVYMNGRTFSDFQGKTLFECVSLLMGAARALERLHDAGYLYLDLKPDNILTLEGTLDLVQLFDFDSAIAVKDLEAAVRANDPTALRSSYTKGYAPLEQQTGNLRRLGKHSDLYSLGAVLYDALWGRTPSAFDCEPSAAYDFERMTYPARNYQDALFPALTAFFHKTLASYCPDRYQDAGEALEQLEKIRRLSDETKPWLRQTPIQRNDVFYGREEEMEALSDLLRQTERGVVSVYGMGGIGKSALVRQYLSQNASDWDAVVWLYDQGSLSEAVADDQLVQVHTLHRMKEESAEEYLRRKSRVLSALAREQRILLVLDNFDGDHLNQLSALRPVGWTILLISRKRLPEGMFPSLQLGELPERDLAKLFEAYAHRDLRGEGDLSAFQTIVSAVNGHTLLTELLARQVAQSYLDMRAAEALIAGFGLADLPEEAIDYIHDQSAYHGTLLKILDRLVEIDRFTPAQKRCMKLLSLFDLPGIDANLFKSLSGMRSLDFVSELEALGWLKTDGRRLYLHPMMQEYIRTWPRNKATDAAAERMMQNLYALILPDGQRHDADKQFPQDYAHLADLLRCAQQMIAHSERTTQASQRLLYRILMDAPVDQDALTLSRMLRLLADPQFLDDDSVLRLYENAAYLQARLHEPEEAVQILCEMKRYLRAHPSDYYLSAYHSAMAVILHNADQDGHLERCLRHEARAIAAARRSSHPEAPKQLAASLLSKATTLLSAGMDREQARSLIEEARPLIERHAAPTDYEAYQYACVAAMCDAMDGDGEAAEAHLKAADEIAFGAPDSDLSVVEHLIEQHAPIRLAMGQYAQAEEAVLRAIALCDRHDEAARYREARFDAYIFLGRIYAMNGEYVKSEAAFGEAERRVEDSPYEWALPLCPKEIREKAEEERRA